jgi:hypothetical protein
MAALLTSSIMMGARSYTRILGMVPMDERDGSHHETTSYGA